jgi:hypothetical protein
MLLVRNIKFKTLLVFIFTTVLFSCGKDNDPDPIIDVMDDDPIPMGFLGEIDYVKTFGGSDEDDAGSIVQANDGADVILGTTKSTDGDLIGRIGDDSDYWLLKLSETGEKLWSKTYGGTGSDVATSIAKTSDGGYVLTGYSESSDGDASVNAGFQDYWIVKIDASGNIQWEKSFGFPGQDQAYKVLQTSEGNYFVSGYFDIGACDPNPDILCPGNDFQGNGQNTRNTRHGVGEFWGILMDANGNKIWRRYFGGSNNDRSYDAVQTNDGGFLITGASESFDFDITDDKGSYDFWAVRLSPTGEKLWTKSFGGSEIEIGYALTKTQDGNYMMVGDTRSMDGDVSMNNGNADAWVVKFDDNGTIIWEKSYGGSEFDSARGVRQMADGSFVITGSSRSANIDVSSNNGQNDQWIFIIDGDGVITFETNIGGSDLDLGNDVIYTSDDKIIAVGNTESSDGDILTNRGIKDFVVIKIK